MKAFTYLLPALAVLASAGKVDECAGSCISKAIASTGCSSSDSHCICSSDSFLPTVEKCDPCGDSHAAAALAHGYCHDVSHNKRDYEWGGHSYSWWEKEWRKVRAGYKGSQKGGSPAPPAGYKPQPAPPAGYKPSPVKTEPAPAPTSYPSTSEHPIEDWFTAHPNYLINHPGWLNNHPGWAAKHLDFLKSHLPKDSPFWGGKPPHSYPSPPSNPPHGYPQPPPNPHPTYTGKPTPTTTCTDKKPTQTVW